MKNVFTTGDVVKVTGLARPRIQEWISRGYIKPSISSHGSHGNPNLWNRQDVYELLIFRQLVDRGFSRKEVVKMISLKAHLITGPMDEDLEVLAFFQKGDELIPLSYTNAFSQGIKGKDPMLGIIMRSTTELPKVDEARNWILSVYLQGVQGFDNVFIINLQILRRNMDAKIKALEGGG